MASSAPYLRKRALIVGINKYQNYPLRYCINDAQNLSRALKSIDFDINFGHGVEVGFNCNLKEFHNIIDKFTNTIQRDDLILFYFAGHGLQIDENNYLLPSDYDYDYRGDERDYIANHAINIKYIMKKIEAKHCRISTYIFDCCRKPVKPRTRNIESGLLAISAPTKSLVVYACAPGRTALDESKNGENGIFAEHLVRRIVQTNLDVEEIMREVASDVEKGTNGFQLPYRTSSLTEKIWLVSNHIPGNNSFEL